MTHSLHRQLSQKLGSAIVLFGIVAAAVSFALSYQEAKEFQDDAVSTGAQDAPTRTGLPARS